MLEEKWNISLNYYYWKTCLKKHATLCIQSLNTWLGIYYEYLVLRIDGSVYMISSGALDISIRTDK